MTKADLGAWTLAVREAARRLARLEPTLRLSRRGWLVSDEICIPFPLRLSLVGMRTCIDQDSPGLSAGLRSGQHGCELPPENGNVSDFGREPGVPFHSIH